MRFVPAHFSRRVFTRAFDRASVRKHHTIVACAAALAIAAFAPQANAQTDFGGYRPTYQGYGVNTPGGRGGSVQRVTHLRDTLDASSPDWNGSLRKALTATGPRFVVFEVSGTISLVSNLVITSPFITVAGQTAPSPGILVRNGHLQIDTHDVVVQHLRIRPGAIPGEPHGIWIRSDANNVVLDHVSVSWTVWTAVDTFAPDTTRGVGDVAIIDSIVAEALGCSGVNANVPCNPATYPSTGLPNSRAFLFGDNNWDPAYNNGRQHIAMIRNLSANNDDRQPAIQGDVDLFYINNLTYNPSQTPWSGIQWTNGFNHGPTTTVAKGNLLIPGPTTPGYNGYVPARYKEEGDLTWGRLLNIDPASQIYLEGNYYAKDCPNNACLASPAAQWSLVKDYMAMGGQNVRATVPPISLVNLPLSTVMPHTAVEQYVLANVGARPLDRDPVDTRIIQNVRNRTGKVVNTPNDVGGYPVLAVNNRALAVPAGANDVVDSVGRTRIEVWLEGYARALEPALASSVTPVPPPPVVIPPVVTIPPVTTNPPPTSSSMTIKAGSSVTVVCAP